VKKGRGGRPARLRKKSAESLLVPQRGWAEGSLRVTMASYLEALAVLQQAVSTAKAQASMLLRFSRWCEDRGLSGPGEVTVDLLERYQRHLFYVRKETGEPLSAPSQHHHLTALKGYFRWCVRQRLVTANPAADLQLPKLGRRLPRYCLTVAEVEKVLGQPRVGTTYGLRDRAMLELLWAGALRRSEVLHLTMHDVRFAEGTVFVSQGKGKKDRVVPISPRCLGWVRRYLDEARPRLWVAPETGRLFLSDTGHEVSPDVFTQRVRKYLDEAGVTAKGSCHLFRHASATALLEGGADVRFVQEYLGHAKLDTTQVYTHVTLTKLKAVYEACHPGARVATAPVPPVVDLAEVTAEDVLAELEGETEDEENELHG